MPISLPSESSEPRPYLPIVKAIAPKAPIGASRMIMPTMAKSTCDDFSIQSKTSVPRPPKRCSAKPNSTENSSTCRISPLANASTTVFGMIVEQEVDRALHLARAGVRGDALGVERGGVDVHAGAGLHEVDDRQADDQRDAC